MSTPKPFELVVAISSRALFDLDESHGIFINQGVKAFSDYQIEHENEPLAPGPAFHLVKKLLHINQRLNKNLVEVVLVSRNSADTGLRLFNSIAHYELPITRAAFTGGAKPYQYLRAFAADLFLSLSPEDVRHALQQQFAAATLVNQKLPAKDSSALKVAFDGDAVLFGDEAEQVFQAHNLATFMSNEQDKAKSPLQGGPFKNFLKALNTIQNSFDVEACPIRTALITARAAPAHERVIRTLRDWNIRIDEALFLGGLEKGDALAAFGADVFFDDQRKHCHAAKEHTTAGHVPHGVKNIE